MGRCRQDEVFIVLVFSRVSIGSVFKKPCPVIRTVSDCFQNKLVSC